MRNKRSNRIFIELGVFTLLFGVALLLPFEYNYYLSSDENNMRTVTLYAHDFQYTNLIIITFLTIILSILSGNRWIIHVLNVLALILVSFGFIIHIYSQGVGWGASPIHPKLGPAYSLTQILTLILIIRSYLLLRNPANHSFNKNLSGFSGILAVAVPISAVIYGTYSIYASANDPIMRSEFELTNDKGKTYTLETWDYMESHDAFVNKFFSNQKLPDGTIAKRLDSAEFSLHAPELPIVKKFTRRAINGELEIEEILDNQQP